MLQQVKFKHQRRQMITTEEPRGDVSLPKHSLAVVAAVPRTKRRKKENDEGVAGDVGEEPKESNVERSSEPTSGGPEEGGAASDGIVKKRRGRPRGSTNKNKLDRMSNQGRPSSSTVLNESSTKTAPAKSRGRGRGRGSGVARSSKGLRGGRGLKGRPGSRTSASPKREKPQKVPIIKKPPPVEVFDEETRMSADTADLKLPPPPQEPEAIVASAGNSFLPAAQDEESQVSQASNISSASASAVGARKVKKFSKDLLIEERIPVTAETIFEYQWPQNDVNAEYFFLQEQISEFLGAKSFRRRYPELQRRVVEKEERDFLRDKKVVTTTQFDLGLTAINSSEVLEILFNDFGEAYEDYRRVVQERKSKEMAKMEASSIPVDRNRSAEFVRRIQKSCSQWNARLNKERTEKRSCVYDLQTGTLNFPAGKYLTLPPAATKMGQFPVVVISGQFCDNFKQYTSNELKYLPLNTVMYGPVHENKAAVDDSDESGNDSDINSSSDDTSSEDISEIQEYENELCDEDSGIAEKEANEVCKTCKGKCLRNKHGKSEVFIRCADCGFPYHPTCLDLTLDMVPYIQKYDWQCSDCKCCFECKDSINEDKMLFCDCCDRGYHIYCVGLRKIPVGRWHCQSCRDCHSREKNAQSADKSYCKSGSSRSHSLSVASL